MHIGTTDLQLKGKRFGKLVVLEQLDERKSGHIMWKCQCDCGAETTVRGGSLTGDNTHSCGCLKTKVRKGNKYGKLTAAERVKTDDGFKWRCECDCGNETLVVAGNLFSGNTKSCGCNVSTRDDMSDYERVKNRQMLANDKSLTYDTWQRKVKNRDDFTCQICGRVHEEKYDIVAHHIDSYQEFPETRTLIENGETLCRWCHTEFHEKYGQRGTTKEQYEEFKDSKTS